MLNLRRQRGLSLVELMVGTAISLVLVAAALAVYARSIQGGAVSGNLVQLNQSMRSIMNVIDYDLHRAGYSANAAAGSTTNAFNQRTTTGTDVHISAGNDCILYSFDLSGDGAYTSANELFGFRFNSTTKQVEVLDQAGANPASWTSQVTNCAAFSRLPMNLPGAVVVNGLSFSTEGSQCLAFAPETFTPSDAATFNRWRLQGMNYLAACDIDAVTRAPLGTHNAGSGFSVNAAFTARAEIRQIVVRLDATHARDSALRRTLTRTIRIRNDRAI